jgi:hypothetical protein
VVKEGRQQLEQQMAQERLERKRRSPASPEVAPTDATR